MSRDGSITLTWGDGEHKFRLPIGQLRELQEKCGAGPPEILNRLSTKRWRVDDIRETIRLGLLGGGMGPVEAIIIVGRYVDERPLMENLPAAQAVLLAALVGVPDEPTDQKKTAETTATPTPTESGSSLPSTESEPPSASTREQSINGASGNTLQ